MSNSQAWQKLAAELRALDRSGDFDTPIDFPGSRLWPELAQDPLTILVNGGASAERYAPVLLRALDVLSSPAELEMVVRALTRKDMTVATERLLRFFADDACVEHQRLLWAVGNALYEIAPRDHLEDCLRICRDARFGSARMELVRHLSRFKKSEEVFQTLLLLLDDESVRGAALEALWRYGDVRALPSIEQTPVREDHYEAKAKNTALRRLNRRKNANAA